MRDRTIKSGFRWLLAVVGLQFTLASGLVQAEDAPAVPATAPVDAAGLEFFEKKIRPVLVAQCYECHAADAKKVGGKLLLDSRDGVRMGGESGAVVELGKPEDSLLIEAILYSDGAVQMPPKGKLPAAVIADFEAWVKMGAPDSRDKPTKATNVATSWPDILRTRREWWSLYPVKTTAVPDAKSVWPASPIDKFIAAKLEVLELDAAPPADPATLARRLSLVLTGLPPTPARLEAFLARMGATAMGSPEADAAVAELVDSLLASPHFGERWARHWMDVVRFTETHGNEWNYEVHHAWRYRDYLIRAFNSDVPYNQFVREHLAGDLLPPRWNAEEKINEAPIGTGFYRFGEANHDDCISLRQIGFDLADNQIDTLSKAFQAMTIACARCHDHKLDAISTADYYALLGVIRSSRMVSHTVDAPEVNATPQARLRELKVELRQELANVWKTDLGQASQYMLAAQAQRLKSPEAEELAKELDAARLAKWVAVLAAEKTPLEDAFEPWRRATTAVIAKTEFTPAWHGLKEQYAKEDNDRTEFNQSQFVTYADFTKGAPADWQVGGLGLRENSTRPGAFTLLPDGDKVVKSVLPAGLFTNVESDKLNGTLRSMVLPGGKKKISFQVQGERSSALRLVSNNCQLNYQNYRALTSPELQWITFSPPEERESLRTYAELMTMFDNPKFPDQLAALGGDPGNYRLPWDKAAENPRSYFGITRVVLHDAGEVPRVEVSHLRGLFAGDEPVALTAVPERFAQVMNAALEAWRADTASDDDTRWLGTLLRADLLSNQLQASPRLEALTKEYRGVEATLTLPCVIVGVGEGPGYNQPVFIRGDCQRPATDIARRYVEVLSQPGDTFAPAESGRRELAERIASAQNPLTARVMVNRIWHHLFGTGLVRSVDDFGHVGELPSHPELLDYLATQFVEDGWSVKRLIRAIVLSRAFQTSNRPSALARERDPQNRLLQHFPARRMEAEAIRDSMLAASGRLDSRLYGTSVQPFRDKEYVDRRLFPGPVDGDGRRSVYIKSNLMEGPKFLEAFNFPGGKVAQGRRDVTNVPAQALALLNDPFVLQQADVWAQKLVARPEESLDARLDTLFLTALGRLPTSDEHLRLQQAIQQLGELHNVSPGEVLKSQAVWKDLAHAMFNTKEFIYIP